MVATQTASSRRRSWPGLVKLDYVLITHYHDDHVGGVPQLVAKFPVMTFIDHGPNRETGDANVVHNFDEYQKVLAGQVKRLTLKPGDKLPLKGVDATVISADGALIDKPVNGGGAANEECATTSKYTADATENSRSLGRALHIRQADPAGPGRSYIGQGTGTDVPH